MSGFFFFLFPFFQVSQVILMCSQGSRVIVFIRTRNPTGHTCGRGIAGAAMKLLAHLFFLSPIVLCVGSSFKP